MMMIKNRWVIEGRSSGVETRRVLGSVVTTKTDWCKKTVTDENRQRLKENSEFKCKVNMIIN